MLAIVTEENASLWANMEDLVSQSKKTKLVSGRNTKMPGSQTVLWTATMSLTGALSSLHWEGAGSAVGKEAPGCFIQRADLQSGSLFRNVKVNSVDHNFDSPEKAELFHQQHFDNRQTWIKLIWIIEYIYGHVRWKILVAAPLLCYWAVSEPLLYVCSRFMLRDPPPWVGLRQLPASSTSIICKFINRDPFVHNWLSGYANPR